MNLQLITDIADANLVRSKQVKRRDIHDVSRNNADTATARYRIGNRAYHDQAITVTDGVGHNISSGHIDVHISSHDGIAHWTDNYFTERG